MDSLRVLSTDLQKVFSLFGSVQWRIGSTGGRIGESNFGRSFCGLFYQRGVISFYGSRFSGITVLRISVNLEERILVEERKGSCVYLSQNNFYEN